MFAGPNAFLFAAARPEHATPLGRMPGKQILALWILKPAPHRLRVIGKPLRIVPLLCWRWKRLALFVRNFLTTPGGISSRQKV